ncbi:MAG: ABC transporter ATP-binding protein [Anaerovoracaceae bacterium]
MSIIQINNISKRFKENILYEDASLEIEGGTTVGIVGGNGSGKSVLFKIIAGLEYPEAGDVYVRGNKVGKDCNFPKDIGLFVNQPGYIEYYDGFHNLKMLAEIQGKIDDETIRLYMKKMGLNPDDKTKVRNYSSGMKQKLGITQAVMENQDIVLLDEPFNALDFQTNREVISILLKLKEDAKTVLLTSHQHEYLEKICDVVYLILNKKLILFDDKAKEAYFSVFGK